MGTTGAGRSAGAGDGMDLARDAAPPPGGPIEAVSPTGDAVRDGIRRGLAYLKAHQEADGFFVAGRLDFKPAYTALVVDVAHHVPGGLSPADRPRSKRPVAPSSPRAGPTAGCTPASRA